MPIFLKSDLNCRLLIWKRNRGYSNSKLNLKQKLKNWMHRKISMIPFPSATILEIGAGTLNHVCWENPALPYDIIEPFVSLHDKKVERSHLRNIYNNIYEVPSDNEYTKILSVAVLEHIENLPWCTVMVLGFKLD